MSSSLSWRIESSEICLEHGLPAIIIASKRGLFMTKGDDRCASIASLTRDLR
jgi:hypothetical protein